MKVIAELVRHFWQRGALTWEEVEYLLRHDFVRTSDLPGYQPRRQRSTEPVGMESDIPIVAPDSLDLVEEELIRRQPVRRGGTRDDDGRTLRIRDLRERLNNEFDRRDADLVSVEELGKRFLDINHWREAASELRNLTDRQFHRGLCAELREGDVLLGDIWQASDPEPFHQLIDDDEARGRAARSFLALLVATGPDELGKYAWVLRYAEMRAVINLRVLHRRLLQSLGRIYHRDRNLLTHALAKNSDPVQVWALVILYNAHRNPRLGTTPQYGKEYGPVPAPDYVLWKRAWTAAMRIDRVKVTRLLVACYQHLAENEDDGTELYIGPAPSSQLPMMCPVGWHLP